MNYIPNFILLFSNEENTFIFFNPANISLVSKILFGQNPNTENNLLSWIFQKCEKHQFLYPLSHQCVQNVKFKISVIV